MMNNLYNLLIVDDEYLVAGSLSTMEEWTHRNIRVVGTASNGVEALEWIKREQIDIVITDIQMPDMDGLELLQNIYALKPDIAVIIISGYEQFDYAQVAIKYRAKGYVLKPIDTDELFVIVDEIVSAPKEPNAEEEDNPKTYHELLVEQTISYLRMNLSNPPTLNEMATQTFLTPHYFGQIFKAISGECYTDYLTNLRMEEARKLLKNPEMKNYEISRRIGYKDVKYFTKIFHRTHMVTPKEFRQSYFNKAK
jgi:two-component system response regulator YesN